MPHDLTGWAVRLNGWATMWLARVAAVVLATLAMMTFADVFARYVLNQPFSFTIEITEMAMGVIVFFGIGLVTHERAHVTVDILTSRMHQIAQTVVSVVVNLVALGYLVLLVWRMWERALELHDLGDVTQILLFPFWPGALLMAFGSVFLLTGVFLHLLNDMADLIRRRNGAEPRSRS